ncbi:MAG: carbonic anhydrase [Planctomycetes bacterium]|nr:carbonic anhydrase [Planctomycetota bacterium]
MIRDSVLGLVACLALSGFPAQGSAQEAGPTPDEALRLLKEGNARFAADNLKEAKPPSRQRLATAQKQKPIAIILTCADSRTAPEYIFDKGLGVLFVVRVAGNVGGPDVYASMEYAADVLKAPLVVVLGHSNCGAVDAVMKEKDLPTEHLKNLARLVRTGDDAKDLDTAIRNNVLAQTEQITRQSSLLKDLASAGRIKIVPAVYDLKSGEVRWLKLKR